MKRLFTILLLLTLPMILCACHGNGVRKPTASEPAAAETTESPSAGSAPENAAGNDDTAAEVIEEESAANETGSIGSLDPNKQYTITFWAKNDTNKYQVAIYKKALADFEALYPNIKVEMQLYTDYSRIYSDVITNIATNTTPNVCITYPDHIATYLTGSNIVANLDPYINDALYGLGGSELAFDSPSVDEMVPEFLDECVINGSHYAIPYMRSTEACYINKDFVEALGYEVPDVLTWDFVWEVSEAAMAKNDDGTFVLNGQNVLIPFIYKSTDNMMIQMVKQLGSGYSTADGHIQLFNDITKGLLYTVSDHAATRAFSTFKISSYPANYLNAGQCIFAIDSTAGATWMGSNAPLLDISADQVVKFTTAVRMIPQFDPESPQMISQGPSICVFNKKDSGEVLASWLFAQFLLTNDVQIAYAETEGYVPVTSKARNSEEYLSYLSRSGLDNNTYYDVKISASRLLLENTDRTFVTPVFNGSANLREAAGQLIEEITKSNRRKETIDDAYMEKLFANVISMKKLDQNGLIIDGLFSEQPIETVDESVPIAGSPDTPAAVQNGSSAAAPSPNTSSGDARSDLGPLPPAAAALLASLAAAWVLLGAYVIYEKFNKKKS